MKTRTEEQMTIDAIDKSLCLLQIKVKQYEQKVMADAFLFAQLHPSEKIEKYSARFMRCLGEYRELSAEYDRLQEQLKSHTQYKPLYDTREQKFYQTFINTYQTTFDTQKKAIQAKAENIKSSYTSRTGTFGADDFSTKSTILYSALFSLVGIGLPFLLVAATVALVDKIQSSIRIARQHAKINKAEKNTWRELRKPGNEEDYNEQRFFDTSKNLVRCANALKNDEMANVANLVKAVPMPG